MPRTYSSIDKILAELAWVNETPDPGSIALLSSTASVSFVKHSAFHCAQR
jgi:hypothetical protein